MLVTGGIVWAIAVLGSVAAGPVALAIVLCPVTVLAVLTAWRATAPRPPGAVAPGPGSGVAVPGLVGGAAVGIANGAAAPGPVGPTVAVRPGLPTGPRLWALVGVGLAPLFALGGVAVLVVAVLLGVALLAQWPASDGPQSNLRSLVAVIVPAIAAGFIVLTARQGTELVVVMILVVFAFDVANSVMGRTPSGGAIGAIAGGISILVLSVIVNALLDPPFTGSSSWLLCLSAAVVAPLGVLLCRHLVPGRVPAIRRLDSLVLVAPLWWIGVVVLLHR